jgi:hypothetical protein
MSPLRVSSSSTAPPDACRTQIAHEREDQFSTRDLDGAWWDRRATEKTVLTPAVEQPSRLPRLCQTRPETSPNDRRAAIPSRRIRRQSDGVHPVESRVSRKEDPSDSGHALARRGGSPLTPPQNRPISTVHRMERRVSAVCTRMERGMRSEATMFGLPDRRHDYSRPLERPPPTPKISSEWSRVIVLASRAPFQA